MVNPIPISSEEQVASFMANVMDQGGEGVIFRNPSAKYHDTDSFLKLVVCMTTVITHFISHNGIIML